MSDRWKGATGIFCIIFVFSLILALVQPNKKLQGGIENRPASYDIVFNGAPDIIQGKAMGEIKNISDKTYNDISFEIRLEKTSTGSGRKFTLASNVDLKPGESYEFIFDAGAYDSIDFVYARIAGDGFSVQNKSDFFYESTLGILGIVSSIISFIILFVLVMKYVFKEVIFNV